MRRLSEGRARDVIDVSLFDDAPHSLSYADAWTELVRVVSARHGVDLNGSHPFKVVVIPVKSNGNHRMSAIIAYPRACRTSEEVMASGAISLFGEMTETLSSCETAIGDLVAIAKN